MRRIPYLLAFLFLMNGCVTMNVAKPITNSFGSSDLVKYKTFTVASSAIQGTPEFLRDVPILKDIAFRFQQEGFQYVNKIDDADFVIVTTFIDAVGQDYIPPQTYTSVSYDPGITTTNTVGTAIGAGSVISLQTNSQSTSTATMTASTVTTGGYFVPNYGVAIALNIYDVKTKTLVWSGAGASRASIQNIYAPIDNVILELIDKNLITPAYLKNEREKIRQEESAVKENEYLKPFVSSDKLGYYEGTYKDEMAGVGVIASMKTQGQMLVLFLSLKNNTNTDFEFDLEKLKIIFQNEKLYKFSKSEIGDYFFKLRNNSPQGLDPSLAKGDPTAFFIGSIIEDVAYKSRQKKVDEAVRGVYKNYIENHVIKPNESYAGYLYVAGPILLSENEKVKVVFPLQTENNEVEFLYKKGWLTVKAYMKKYGNK